jgi:hypothetical protein
VWGGSYKKLGVQTSSSSKEYHLRGEGGRCHALRGGGGVFDETRWPKLHLELLERMKRCCFGVMTGPVASASLGSAMHRSVDTRENTYPLGGDMCVGPFVIRHIEPDEM